MTIREYITGKLQAFEIPEAQFADMFISLGLDASEELSFENSRQVGVAMVEILEELILAPRRTNISENGFSISWDFASVGKYYRWLCTKYDKEPDKEVLGMLGISMITDKTDTW